MLGAMLVSIALLASPDAAGPSGRVSSPAGSCSFRDKAVFSQDMNIAQGADGSWRGQIGKRFVNASEEKSTVQGDPALVLRDRELSLLFVHHQGAWYARGSILGTPIKIFWPDNQSLSSWGPFSFEGIAKEANPPIVAFVFAIYGSVYRTGGSVDVIRRIEAGTDAFRK